MKKLFNPGLLLFMVVLFFSNLAIAQKLFEGSWDQNTNYTSYASGKPKKEITKQQAYYKQGKIKIVDLTDGDITIFRFDKNLMWTIDKTRGTYTEMKFDDVQKEINKSKAAMKEEMKNMTPEERKMMEQMMGKNMSALLGDDGEIKISIKATGESKMINGYNCKKVVYLMNNEPFMDLWLTDKYRLGTEFIEMYKKMGMFQADLSDEAKKINGFPIQTQVKISSGIGETENVTTVTNIVPKSLSDSEFDLPGGLKKVSLNHM